jgi:hypothetical protein
MFNTLPVNYAVIYPDALSWFNNEKGKAIPYLAVYSKWLKEHGFVFDGRGWSPARTN